MRKFLCDHLSSFMSESKWKQVVGKQISEGAYVSPDTLREDYARAMGETTFTKRASDDIQKIAKLEALKLFAKSSGGFTEADIARIKMRKPTATAQEEIDELEKMLAKSKEEDCPDGEHCAEFSQIPEAQLLTHLKDGWEIVKELSDGQIIVKRVS